MPLPRTMHKVARVAPTPCRFKAAAAAQSTQSTGSSRYKPAFDICLCIAVKEISACPPSAPFLKH